MLPTIILFAKAPRSGFAKTRLAADVGEVRALKIYRWMAKRQLCELPEGWPLVVRFTPADAEAEMQAWLGDGILYLPQCDGDLGARMLGAAGEAFEAGAPAVVLIGADCPSLSAADLEEARQYLDQGTDVVFGPSVDGGFYLLAMSSFQPQLFAGIRWSTAEVLSDSLEAADRIGLKTQLLQWYDDVDTLSDLQRAVETGCIPGEILE